MTSPLFFTHHATDPWFNMAFDEWLLARAEQTPGFAAVRLYTWCPGAITFGVNQKESKAFRAEQLGDTPVIRRVTGGRAIYHDPSELTYAVAVHGEGCPVAAWRAGRSATATSIARLLQSFLARVGINTDYARQSSTENARPDFFHSAPCFASHARYELLGTSGKVVASAQRRLDHSFLQHGAIKPGGVAPHPALGSERGHRELPALTEDRFETLAAAFTETFRTVYDHALEPGVLSAAERTQIAGRAEEVRKNNRLRRDVIKQSEAGVSL